MAFWNHSGPGAVVTQATSKATAVNCNGPCGVITTVNTAIAAGAATSFTVNTGHVAVNDTVALSIVSGAAAAGSYVLTAEAVANGSFVIAIRNPTAGILSEAIVISFAIMRNGI